MLQILVDKFGKKLVKKLWVLLEATEIAKEKRAKLSLGSKGVELSYIFLKSTAFTPIANFDTAK